MASTSSSYPLLLLLLLLAAPAAAAAEASVGVGVVGGGNATTATSSSPTAYEMLERYDFPRGILPAGVSGYELRGDGSFEVYFPRRCEFLLAGTWLVRYEPRVRGSVAAGSLTALDGISVKVLFLWLGVGEVDRAGDTLSFYIGPVATSFPLDDFAESPRCRGYDYDGDGDGAAAGDDLFPAAAVAASS
ncbi:hypothetical protein BDA96_08G075700 [Sorghum bicolor]|jgi:hypothetical protein|uniref:Uncharacterized protein n=1 Tax=Sorghum bicolor TaxID=4558 RepID=A0A921QHE6_SORBI|nr:hypothetical protein BDA96_08G075700 [Sorghum bicolor]